MTFLFLTRVFRSGNHGIIASKRCNDVSIQNNEVWGSADHGIMLHRSSDKGIIRNNTVTNSGSACIAIFESFGESFSLVSVWVKYEKIRPCVLLPCFDALLFVLLLREEERRGGGNS